MTQPPAITFTAQLMADGEMSAIPITFDQRAVFGKARPPVVVAINGHTYRSTIAIMSGETFVPLRRSARLAANVDQAGAYEVTLTLDTAPREVELPNELAAALDAAGVRAGWDKLSFTAQREYVEAIADAKREETRTKRLVAAVQAAAARA